ncbi:MAG: CesT family type III secretion system chaperone [Victivallales bacterium]|nr:CesT family type III secretion system chaperone [Victivallales bacterium]
MELDQLLERFGKDTGLGQLTMDEADTCTFLVDDMKVSLMHIAEGEHLLCYAES